MTCQIYGKGIADAFAAEFTKLGGTVVDREGADPKHHRLLADPDQVRGPQPGQRLLRWRHRQRRWPCPQADAAGRPGRRCRSSAATASRTGNGGAQGSFINIAGAAAANSFSYRRGDPRHPRPRPTSRPSTRPSTTPIPAPTAPRATPAPRSSSRRSAAAAAKGDMATPRERPRIRRRPGDDRSTPSSARSSSTPTATPASRSSRCYKVDMTAASGKGDWTFVKQINYGQ